MGGGAGRMLAASGTGPAAPRTGGGHPGPIMPTYKRLQQAQLVLFLTPHRGPQRRRGGVASGRVAPLLCGQCASSRRVLALRPRPQNW